MSLFTCKILGSISKVIYMPGSIARCAGRLGEIDCSLVKGYI